MESEKVKLHEKTLSDLAEELDIVFNKYYKVTFENGSEKNKELLNPSSVIIPIVEDYYKQKTIDKIKKCKNDVGIYYDIKLVKCGEYFIDKIHRCQACVARMKDFEITEEMLNGT